MTLGDVHVNRDGTIRYDGDPIGLVSKMDKAYWEMGRWRAEIGDPAKPAVWPGYRVVYADARMTAVKSVLDSVPNPEHS